MKKDERIIVSLTSFPAAIPYAVQAIRSVLRGSLLPDKVVLYLDTQKFPGWKHSNVKVRSWKSGSILPKYVPIRN